jgi:ABC-type phosphate/phosphonate transport system substrate-binding protein
MIIVRPSGATSEGSLNRAAGNVQDALLEETGLVVEIELVEHDSDGVAALCDAIGGTPAVAWVSGVGYAAASAEGCGVPALMVEQGTGQRATTGEEVQIIVNRALGITEIAALAGQTFCRLGYDDLYTWLVPNLMLRAGGISEMPDAVDSPDIEALVEAVAAGDCDAAGISASDFDEFGDDADDSVRALSQTVTIPYAVFMYPPATTLDTRTRLVDGLMAMAESSDLETLLDQDGLTQVNEGDLDDLNTFLSNTGLDFARLGN